MMARYRIGVDIGGTFTDAVLADMDTGETILSKVPTTPSDPSIGFLNSIDRVLASLDVSRVLQIIHATTIATNSIIEGKTSKAAFITTKGFKDLLEIQRQIRPKLYDIFFQKPKPLVPRWLCFEVTERLNSDGAVTTPLDEGEVSAIGKTLKQEEVEAAAICLLHAYRNPIHERRIAEILHSTYPDLFITCSSEISSQFREYPRASTTVINASVMPVVQKYLTRLEGQLANRGIEASFYVMQSSGGIMTSASAKRSPAYIVESGPAAGVIAAASIGGMGQERPILSFDMGGTTAKVGMIEKGQPKMAAGYEVGVGATPETGLTKGAGYPLTTPVVDLVEIGAGGGSIGWIDSGGALKVGPQSAGADPGPACYPKGGKLPTITDANVILGRIEPDHFLGGEMKLNKQAAEAAIKEHCATVMGGDIVATAMGIVEIANANMLRAMRLVSIERGHDPRDFVMIAFGGAGPMHANAIADELGVSSVIVPLNPGVTSALGLLMTNLRHDYVRTCIEALDTVDFSKINTIYQEMESDAVKTLLEEHVSKDDITLNRYMGVRYIGQSYELVVPCSSGVLTQADSKTIANTFFTHHRRTYGHASPEEPVEIVDIRLVAQGTIARPKFKEIEKGGRDPESASMGRRQVFFKELGGSTDTPTYDRYKLKFGNIVDGPAIIQDMDSTTVVHPSYEASTDKFALVTLRKK